MSGMELDELPSVSPNSQNKTKFPDANKKAGAL
jgi:hypothetical protein